MTAWRKIPVYIILTITALLVAFPLLFSLSLSFTSNRDIMNGIYIPSSFSLENYKSAFRLQPLLHYLKNSLIASTLATGITILLSLLAAYALVFINFKGKNLVFGLFLATMMIPSEVLVISNFQTVRSLGLMNTFAGLILPGLSSTFCIFLLRQNLKQIPFELKDAGEVAGAGDFYFFVKVVIPMARNAIATLAVYQFLVCWNSYLWPLLSTTNEKVRTVQIGLRQLKNADAQNDFGMMAAGAVIVSIPTLFLIFLGQRRLSEGLSKGALK